MSASAQERPLKPPFFCTGRQQNYRSLQPRKNQKSDPALKALKRHEETLLPFERRGKSVRLFLLHLNGTYLIVPPVLRKTPCPKGIVVRFTEGLAFPLEINVLINSDLANVLTYYHTRNLIIPGGTAKLRGVVASKIRVGATTKHDLASGRALIILVKGDLIVGRWLHCLT